MLISHSHKFIFIHVSKTGGTSIKQALNDYKDFNMVDISPNNTLLSDEFSKHITAHELKISLASEIFDNYHKFLFVRNPWERLVSMYFYTQQNRSHFNHNIVHSMTFQAFLEWRLSTPNYINQSDCVTDETGNIIVDFIGKYENINSDFMKICQDLNIMNCSLPYLNKSEHKNYRDYYTSKTEALVRGKLYKEIKLFKYEI